MNLPEDPVALPGDAILISRSQALAALPQIQWALGEFEASLAGRDVAVSAFDPASSDTGGEMIVILARAGDGDASLPSPPDGFALPREPESFAIFRATGDGADRLHVYGADMRGLVYAITELADRVRCAPEVKQALHFPQPLVEAPTAKVRSISKCFVSEVEDLPWFHDREGWQAYLTMLVTHRFNRFSLTLGMQYNYPYGNEFLSDVYFYLAYPFLVSVPGYDVSVSNLDEEERLRNLETLKFIGREAELRGIDFQLALWTQNYDFEDCPNARHQIVGLGPHNIAPYCRDALAAILAEVPQITGLTLRVHVESGIPEGDYAFWRTYFEAVRGAGRTIRLDLHAKGIDGELIETALATGMPVAISPKYTSEHLGLPYHQASIRPLELPLDDATLAELRPGRDMTTLYSGRDAASHARKWKFSEGSRKFMRYSYGDLLREDRRYTIMFRIWPGTTRILLWGDPALAGGYGRHSVFDGCQGVELCEPLSFKGRMGTGIAASRTGYRQEYRIHRHDWQKFEYTYRVWGRSLFNPYADPEAFQRHLKSKFGAASAACGAALASASRILPLITLAHTPTASNNSYWPEMYENMSIVHEAPQLPYGYELAKPARFGTVGACDPQLFMSPAELARCIRNGQAVRRIAPLTWANWLEQFALSASAEMARASATTGKPGTELFLVGVDVTILAAIGRFFAEKTRAAVFWEYYLLCGNPDAAAFALDRYRKARDAWSVAAQACRDVYMPDLTYGPHSWLRGRWDDRLSAIEKDIADMETAVAEGGLAFPDSDTLAPQHLKSIVNWSRPQVHVCAHTPAPGFVPGEAVDIALSPSGAARRTVVLHYRHVDQSQPWQSMAMQWRDGAYRAVIPAEYTDAPYAIAYYFEIEIDGVASFCPGLAEDLSNAPYFLLRPAGN